MDVKTAKQWEAAGISQGRLRTLVRDGQLVRRRRGAYVTAQAVAAAGDDPARGHALDVQAVLAAASGEGAAASHESAAVIHGLSLLHAPASGAVTLTRPPGAYQGRSAAGVRYYAARLPAGHVTVKFGTPVTTLSRTVIDLARTLPFMDAVVVADAAIRRRVTSRSKLSAVIGDCTGWPGVDRARRVAAFSDGRAESPLESCARVVFDAFGLPAPELQAEITVVVTSEAGGRAAVEDYAEYRADFLWRDQMTIAETDGLAKYGSRQDAIRQLRRDRLLRDMGYKVVHITWAELHGHPERVISQIRRACEAPGP